MWDMPTMSIAINLHVLKLLESADNIHPKNWPRFGRPSSPAEILIEAKAACFERLG